MQDPHGGRWRLGVMPCVASQLGMQGPTQVRGHVLYAVQCVYKTRLGISISSYSFPSASAHSGERAFERK